MIKGRMNASRAVDPHSLFADPDPVAFFNRIRSQRKKLCKNTLRWVFCSWKKACSKVNKNQGGGPNLLLKVFNKITIFYFPISLHLFCFYFWTFLSWIRIHADPDLQHCCWINGLLIIIRWLPARAGRAYPHDGVDLLQLYHPEHRGLRHGGREVRPRGPLLQTERLPCHTHQVEPSLRIEEEWENIVTGEGADISSWFYFIQDNSVVNNV